MTKLEGLLDLFVVVAGIGIFVLSLVYWVKVMFLEGKILQKQKHKKNLLVSLEMVFPFLNAPTNDPDVIERRKVFSRYLLCIVVFGAMLLATLLIVQPSSAP